MASSQRGSSCTRTNSNWTYNNLRPDWWPIAMGVRGATNVSVRIDRSSRHEPGLDGVGASGFDLLLGLGFASFFQLHSLPAALACESKYDSTLFFEMFLQIAKYFQPLGVIRRRVVGLDQGDGLPRNPRRSRQPSLIQMEQGPCRTDERGREYVGHCNGRRALGLRPTLHRIVLICR